MVYGLVRPLLFAIEPEKAHGLAMASLRLLDKTGMLGKLYPPHKDEVTLWGLKFSNRIGLAAGLDKDGDSIDALSSLGFGFLEIGTVTPLPQDGNPRPRMFRLVAHQALINRLGFNNLGVDRLVQNVRASRRRCVLGISIGKNAKTSEQNTIDDYLFCLERAFPVADYVAVNISSPNTVGLRGLQFLNVLPAFLNPIKDKQLKLQRQYGRMVPLLVKIAPDLSSDEVRGIGRVLLDCGVDGVIATNSTITRSGVESHPLAFQAGGLTGAPLSRVSLRVVRELAEVVQGRLPIVGSGGVMSPTDAAALVEAGADLVQLYTGLIYNGPSFIAKAARAADAAKTVSLWADSPQKRLP